MCNVFLWRLLYIYICIYIYMIYVYMCVYIYIYIYTYTRIHMRRLLSFQSLVFESQHINIAFKTSGAGDHLPIYGWYSIVQYSIVQYSIVQYSIVQYSIVQYSIVQNSIVQYRAGDHLPIYGGAPVASSQSSRARPAALRIASSTAWSYLYTHTHIYIYIYVIIHVQMYISYQYYSWMDLIYIYIYIYIYIERERERQIDRWIHFQSFIMYTYNKYISRHSYSFSHLLIFLSIHSQSTTTIEYHSGSLLLMWTIAYQH